MLCSDVKMECFCEGHNASSGLEPREKNHVSGSVKCACFRERVLCSVYTPHIIMMVGVCGFARGKSSMSYKEL